MTIKHTILVGAALACFAPAGIAQAQAAAESAIILGGTGASTGAASRSLGNAVRSSVGSAANAVNAANRARVTAGTYRGNGSVRASNSSSSRSTGTVIASGVDSLEGSDAASYKTASGATIKVSGRMNPSSTTVCTENCDQ